MTKLFCLSCCLLFLCVSCADSARLAGVKPQPAWAEEETADSGCAYFYFLWGKSAEANGRLEEAREAYEKALVCDGAAAHVMRNLAVLLARMDLKEEAAACLEKIRSRRQGDTETLIFVANLYAAMEMADEAGEIYRLVLGAEPDNFEAALLLGTLYARNRQYPEAREMLERLVQIDPGSYLGHYYLGKLYQELHEFDKALASYRRALDLNWAEGLAYEAANLYEKLNRHQEAVSLYRELLTRDPADERAHGGLAGVYLQEGKLDQAMAELRELRHYAVDIQKVDFTIGRLLIEQDRYEEAIAQFSQLLAEDPGFDAARYLLALIHYEQGSTGKAAELLRQVPPGAQNYEDATLLLVRILQDEKDAAGVEALLKARLADEATRRPVLYMALASFYQEQEQPEQGREVYAEALARYPDDSRVLFQYGLFLERSDHQEEAMAQMQKVLAMEPSHPYALNYVGYTWADQGVNLPQALDCIEQAVALKPRDGFIRDSLGWVYYRLGEMDRARTELEKARELEPDDPHIHEHLGDVYLDSHQPREARKAYERAYELYEEGAEKEAAKSKLEAIRP